MVPTPGRGGYRHGRDLDSPKLAQPAHQLEVFHQWDVRKAAHSAEGLGLDEQRLIAVGQLQDVRTPIGHPLHQSQGPPGSADPQQERAGANSVSCEHFADVPLKSGRQNGISVKKQQNVAGRGGRAEILLTPPARRGTDHRGAAIACNFAGAVMAVTVGDDHLMDAGLLKLINCRGDAILFVARGDNDGDTA